MKQMSGARSLTRQVLIVDGGLAGAAGAAARSERALIDELKARNIRVIEAVSYEDGMANAVSDSGIHCILLNWTDSKSDKAARAQATELLRAVRKRNAKLPIFLMASRDIAGSVSIEVATLSDEFIWILEDTAAFISGRVQASIERYLANLLPPYAAALASYDREREYSWAAPGHQGGVGFLKSPVGRAFFDFFGENLFRTDMGIERGALGSMLGHSGPVGESERFAARVFGAHRSYTVTNGTSASNRAIMSACVGDNEIALCDRNCHKSIEQGLFNTGGIPVFLMPTRNRYGIIGPIPPEQLEPKAIAKCIAANPLAKASGHKRAVYSVLTNCTYDGMCYDAADAEARLGKSVDRIHFDEAWYGYARFNPLYRDRYAMRGDPATHAKDGPTVFATHSTHKLLDCAVADVVHPHPRRPRRHRSRALQRGVLHAGEHIAALRADCVERRCGRDHGRPGRAGAHAGNHRRGRRMPPCGCARAPGVSREEGLVLCAVERGAACATRRAASASRFTKFPRRSSPRIRATGSCTPARAGMASKICRTAGACSIRSSSASSARA